MGYRSPTATVRGPYLGAGILVLRPLILAPVVENHEERSLPNVCAPAARARSN
jgi:hypothetical protein